MAVFHSNTQGCFQFWLYHLCETGSGNRFVFSTSSYIFPLHLSSSAPSTELSALIEKLQKNADKVEKNIYDVEQNLNKVLNIINWHYLFQKKVNEQEITMLNYKPKAG